MPLLSLASSSPSATLAVPLFKSLVPGEMLLAYQLAFDLVEDAEGASNQPEMTGAQDSEGGSIYALGPVDAGRRLVVLVAMSRAACGTSSIVRPIRSISTGLLWVSVSLEWAARTSNHSKI